MKTETKKRGIQTLILKLVVAWAIITFVIYPNLNLLVSVFYQNGRFSTEVFGKVLSSARAMKSLGNSFILAFTLAATVNIAGTLCVLFTEYWDIKCARLLRLAYMSSLIYGVVVLVVLYSFCDSLTIKTGNISIRSFTLENYGKLFTSMEALKPYLVSIVYSLPAAVTAAVIAIICARFVRTSKRKYDKLFEYSMLVPVIFPAIMSIIILNFNKMLSGYDLSVFLYNPLFQPLGIVIKAASDESASIDAKAMSFVYTVVLMLLSSVALYFGQGNGMDRIRRWRQKRLEHVISGAQYDDKELFLIDVNINKEYTI